MSLSRLFVAIADFKRNGFRTVAFFDVVNEAVGAQWIDSISIFICCYCCSSLWDRDSNIKTMKNIFLPNTTAETIARIDQLNADSKPVWGKMNAAQMLAHCAVAYEMVYTDKHKAPNGFVKFMLKAFVKKGVVNEVPYKRNLRTAPQFIIANERDFEAEKSRLIDYIRKTEGLGADHFDGKENMSFGAMPLEEWNNLFYKHLDHHLRQFGV